MRMKSRILPDDESLLANNRRGMTGRTDVVKNNHFSLQRNPLSWFGND